MNQEHIIILLCALLLMFGIGTFGYLMWKCNQEHFGGVCQGVGIKTNPDRDKLRQMYQEGKLTENTALKTPSNWQGMSWDNFLDKQDKEPMNKCNNGKQCC